MGWSGCITKLFLFFFIAFQIQKLDAIAVGNRKQNTANHNSGFLYLLLLWWSWWWWWWWWSPACRVAESGRSGRYICAFLSQLVTRVFIEKRVFYDQTDHDRFSCQSFRTKFASVLIKSLFASLPACPQNARILFISFNIILFCFFLLYATLSFIICLYPHLTDWPLALIWLRSII